MNVKRKKHLIWCTILLTLNLCFIWGNSLLPGSISGAFSHWVQKIISLIFPSDQASSDSGHGLLRKLAHFTEFCTLGMLFIWLFQLLHARRWRILFFPWICGAVAACIDETMQIFIPGRGPAIKDVGIDTLGVTLGIVIIYFISKIKKKLKHLEEQSL